eukprot:scaffold973_cov399-Prasinococcus_capsulatus_cf.AAC.20
MKLRSHDRITARCSSRGQLAAATEAPEAWEDAVISDLVKEKRCYKLRAYTSKRNPKPARPPTCSNDIARINHKAMNGLGPVPRCPGEAEDDQDMPTMGHRTTLFMQVRRPHDIHLWPTLGSR